MPDYMNKPEDPLESLVGANKIYLLERNANPLIIPTRTAKNMMSWRISYPDNYDKILSGSMIEETFVPGITAYLKRLEKSEDDITRLLSMIFWSNEGLEEWHMRRTREYNGSLKIDGPHPNSPEHGSEYAGTIISKAESIRSLNKIIQ